MTISCIIVDDYHWHIHHYYWLLFIFLLRDYFFNFKTMKDSYHLCYYFYCPMMVPSLSSDKGCYCEH